MIATLSLLFQLQALSDPRSVLAQATRAVEGDSGARIAQAWTARVEKDSTDWAAWLGLATLARLSYDYRQADSLYERLIRVSAPGAARYAAAARLELGRSHQVRGLNTRADSAYGLAIRDARRVGESTLEAGALIALGMLRSRTVGPVAGDSLLRHAARLVSTDDFLLQSDLHCSRAALLQMTGRPGVEAEARQGAGYAERAGVLRQRAFCWRVLAVALLDRDADSGVTMFRAVVDELDAVHDRAALASVLQWRGYQRFLGYDYGLARADFLRAVEEGRTSGALSPVAWALLGLAQVTAWAGDLVSAHQYADSAETLFTAQGDQWGLGALQSIQAEVTYLTDDYPTARDHLDKALVSARATGYLPTIILLNVGRGVLEMDHGNLDAAERHLMEARRVARVSALPGHENGLTYHFARLALLRGRPEVAVRELEKGLRAVVGNQAAVTYQWHARLAEARMLQGRVAEAEKELRLATDGLDAARAGFSDAAQRATVLQSLHDARDAHLGIARVLAGLVTADRVPAAFELTERLRARSLLEALMVREALSQREVRTADPVKSAPRVPVVGIAEIVAAVPDDRTALLEYVTGTDGAPTTLFVVSRSGTRALRLAPLDSLAGDLRRFMALIESGESPVTLGRSLGDALLAPAIAALGATVSRLVIVPDAGLHRLAFDALTLPDGQLVAERYSVSFAPSAAIAARLWRLPPQTRPVELLAFGDPQFAGEVAAGTEAAVYRGAFDANGGLVRLAASAGEAKAVARFAPSGEVRLRGQASEAYLKRTSLRRFRVLHLAAHALVDEQAPTRTALALAPGEGEDGFVTAADIAALDLDADLVLLSACRTAGGVFVRGEGVEGLTAPLLETGARSVVASLWQVGDRTTADFVETFYRGLAAGASTGEALAAAKRDAIRRGLPPAVWAAFTLVGNPGITIPLRAPMDRRWLVLGVGAVALAAVYGAAVFRRRMAERT